MHPPTHTHTHTHTRAAWEVGVETRRTNLAEIVPENVTGFLTQSHVTFRNKLSTTYSPVPIELLLKPDKLQDN